MNVLFFSPGYPAEMPLFVRGLTEVGARVYGLGDQPAEALAEGVRRRLSGYIRVDSLWDEEAVVRRVRSEPGHETIERVECLWEPGMLVAARLREALGLAGMTVEQTIPFRDKTAMKRALERAGLRCPRHARADSFGACREAAERIGYPLILKPVAGAGSADTYRVDGPDELERMLPLLRHVPEVSVEEFIDGEEFTFDTICHGGEIAYVNMCWYRPRPLIARSLEWVSPQTVALRDLGAEHLQAGAELGRKVLQALGFRTGFTHMEWFRTPKGEAVFGEIGARPPGARTVDIMNFAGDTDLFRGWGEAVCHHRFSEPTHRLYNVAIICKRAQGQGRIRRIEGLGSLLARYGPSIVSVDLLPIGAPRRDWKQTLLSDGWLIVRHPDLETMMRIADAVGTDLRLHAA